MLLTILRNVQYLGRQGMAFRGSSEKVNLKKLMQLSTKTDPRVGKRLEKKRNMYSSTIPLWQMEYLTVVMGNYWSFAFNG